MTRFNIFKKRKRLSDVNETFFSFDIYIDTNYMLKKEITTKFKNYSIQFLSRENFLESVEKTKLPNNIINTTQLRHWATRELVVFLKYINDFRDDHDNFVDAIESWNIMFDKKVELLKTFQKIENAKDFYKRKYTTIVTKVIKFIDHINILKKQKNDIRLTRNIDRFENDLRSKKIKRIFEFFKFFIFTNDIQSLYDIWKLRVKNKFKINANWWLIIEKKINIMIIWIFKTIVKHLDVKRKHDFEYYKILENVF